MSEDYDYDNFSDIEEKYSESKRKKIDELEQFQNQIIKKRYIVNPKLRNEEEKRMLLEVLRKEPMIWDKNDKLHCNCRALSEAWKRVADEIPSMTVSDCRAIWKSLKDALRYRKKVSEKENNNESIDVGEEGEENELEIMFSLLTPSVEEEKRMLLEVLRKEPMIWDKNDKLHRNSHALSKAWQRVADEIPSMTVTDCRTIWKNLKEALRYRKKVSEKEKNNESIDVGEDGEENELEIMFSLLTPSKVETTSKFSSKAESDHDESENMEEKDKKLTQVKKYQVNRENKILRRKLTAVIKKEDVIWNPRNRYYRNPSATFAAWERIAGEMHPMTVEECKVIWKSVRYSIRNSVQKKKQIAESEKKEIKEDFKQENETNDSNGSYQKSRRTKPIQKVLIPDTIDNNEASNSIPGSNFSDVSENDETNEVFESLGSISKAISELVSVAASSQQPSQSVNSFKYDYIWRLIENLYGQLNESTINEVNQQIINLVYENCKPERG